MPKPEKQRFLVLALGQTEEERKYVIYDNQTRGYYHPETYTFKKESEANEVRQKLEIKWLGNKRNV